MANVPLFNQDHLNKQKRQIINNTYTQLGYIQQECKPFVSAFQKGTVPCLRTNERLKFQTLSTENILLDNLIGSKYNKSVILNLDQKGKFVIFPSGEFTIFWNKDHLHFSEKDLSDLPPMNWISEDLDKCLEENGTVIITTPKLYVIEYSMYVTIEQKLKTLFLGKSFN
jgi:hypothetical protein